MKHLWLILFVIVGCATSPNVTPEQRKENAVMVMRNGEKINGTLNDYDYETGKFTFTSKDGKLYTNPESVKEVMDIWGVALLYDSHIKVLNNKRYELGLSDKSGDQISSDEISRGQQKFKPYDYELESSSSPSDSNAGREVAKYLLNAYNENKRESNYSSPSLSFGDAQKRGCNIYGKIKFVELGEDYKIKFVDNFENLKVKYVEFGEQQEGNWEIVDFGEDYKIKVVESDEDFTVKQVSYGEGCN